MGEVYRARDSTLNRDVALKVRPAVAPLDADRFARVKREAQILAALNHPNIAAIYGLEDSEGVQALVLELVEGSTLQARIGGGRIPIGEALSIAGQIAEGLEAAHDRGIIHSDLKPANIKLRPDGTVKILDFGLAKDARRRRRGASASDQAGNPSAALSQTRLVFGTAAYMSPEQARGEPLDERTDIWGFGCVLYEMLTGRPAFHGETIEDILAAVREREPDWSLLPAETPAEVCGCCAGVSRRMPIAGFTPSPTPGSRSRTRARHRPQPFQGNGAGRRLSPSPRPQHSRLRSRPGPGCGRRVPLLTER